MDGSWERFEAKVNRAWREWRGCYKLVKNCLKISEPRIYGAGAVAPNPRWHMPAHFHSFHEIIAVRQGRYEVKSPEKTVSAEAGDIVFYRAGFVHEETTDAGNPVGIEFIAFDTGDPLPWLPLRTRDTQGRVREVVRWLIDDVGHRRAPELRRPLFDVLLGELRLLCAVPPDPWLEACWPSCGRTWRGRWRWTTWPGRVG